MLVSPELAEVLTAIIFRVCAGNAAQATQITIARDPLEWRPHDFL